MILIGGPPCQAYSLAGRGRKPGDLGYVPHVENRHRLYEEYIHVLRQLRPAAFVMENVKGMLSSSIEKKKVFDLVTQDLMGWSGEAEYMLCPLSGVPSFFGEVLPRSFIVEAERYGVPQARGPGTKGCGHWTTHRRPIISVAAAQLALDGFARARRLMMLELVCLTEPVILTNLWIQSAVN